MLIGLVTVVIDTAGTTTSFVEVVEAVAVLLAVSVAVTLYVIVPSVSELTLMPLMLQVPPAPTVVVLAAVVCVPSVTVTDIVVPTSPVPLIVVVAAFDALIGFVTVVMAMVGATSSLVEVLVVVAELPTTSMAVAV